MTELLDYFPDDDGFTLKAYIKAFPLVHNEVRIQYRPVELLERAVLLTFKEKNYEKTICQNFSEVLAKRIVSWSLTIKAGDAVVPMEITAKNVERLKPALWVRLVNIVIWGIDGGDVDPGLSTAEIADRLASDMDALLNKQTFNDAKVEEIRKN